MRRNLLLLLGSLLACFVLFEGVLRMFFAAPPAWLEPQTRHLKSPLLGWVLPPHSQGYTIDAPVQTNALGLRDDELLREKPPGETRILSLGDSFTYALGVRFEDLYVQQLERALRDSGRGGSWQVINAGVAGYNTRQELIYLLADGFSLQPDVIIVGFYWNDLVGNDEELPDLERTPRVSPDDPQARLDENRHLLPRWIRDPLRRSLVLYLTVTRAQMVYGLFHPSTDSYAKVQRALLAGDSATLAPYWAATEKRLLELARAASERNIPVVLVAFPDENQIRHGEPSRGIGPELARIWAPTGMPFVDLEPAYREALAAGRNPYLPYDLHPNVEGMRLAAQTLYDVVSQLRPAIPEADQPSGRE